MLAFFRTLLGSIRDLQSYKTFAERKNGSAIWHLTGKLWLYLLFLFVGLFVLALSLRPMLESAITRFGEEAPASYPAGLIITIKGGHVSVNQPEPLFLDLHGIPLPPQARSLYDHLIAIDTNASPEDYAKYRSFFLVTANAVVVENKNEGSSRIISLSKAKDQQITQETFDTALREGMAYLNQLPSLLVRVAAVLCAILPFVTLPFCLLGYVIYLLIISLIVLFIASIMGRSWNFGAIFRMSIHALTIPILYSLVATFFPPLSVRFLPSILLIVILSYVIRQLPAPAQPNVPAPTTT